MRHRISQLFVLPTFVCQNPHRIHPLSCQFHLSFDPVCGEFAVSFANFSFGYELTFYPSPHLWALSHGLDDKFIIDAPVWGARIKQVYDGIVVTTFFTSQAKHTFKGSSGVAFVPFHWFQPMASATR